MAQETEHAASSSSSSYYSGPEPKTVEEWLQLLQDKRPWIRRPRKAPQDRDWGSEAYPMGGSSASRVTKPEEVAGKLASLLDGRNLRRGKVQATADAAIKQAPLVQKSQAPPPIREPDFATSSTNLFVPPSRSSGQTTPVRADAKAEEPKAESEAAAAPLTPAPEGARPYEGAFPMSCFPEEPASSVPRRPFSLEQALGSQLPAAPPASAEAEAEATRRPGESPALQTQAAPDRTEAASLDNMQPRQDAAPIPETGGAGAGEESEPAVREGELAPSPGSDAAGAQPEEEPSAWVEVPPAELARNTSSRNQKGRRSSKPKVSGCQLRAIADHTPAQRDEIPLKVGDILVVTHPAFEGRYKARPLNETQEGWIPEGKVTMHDGRLVPVAAEADLAAGEPPQEEETQSRASPPAMTGWVRSKDPGSGKWWWHNGHEPDCYFEEDCALAYGWARYRLPEKTGPFNGWWLHEATARWFVEEVQTIT